jgi:prepilin-type N-terminal cleavage/methylation domain-containing protein
MRSQRQNGFTLIGTLIVIVIMGILAVILIPRLISGGKDPVTGKRTAPPRERAKQVETVMYIGQINQAIQMYRMDHDNQNPRALAELKAYGVTDEMMRDAVTHQPLPYNAQTGQVGKSTGPDGLGGGGNLPRVRGF